MALQARLVLMGRRESLALQGPLELLVPVVVPVTAERPDPPGLQASLAPLVPMASLEPRESRVRAGRRVTLVPLVLRVPLDPPDLPVPPVFLDPKVPVELRAHLVLLDSLELQAESDLRAPTVTRVLLVLRELLVKTVPRVFVVTVVLPVVRETLGCVGQQAPQERRESRERMAPLVPTGHQDPRVWLDSVVLWVCLGSVEREGSLAFRDLPGNPANRELLAEAETAAPPAPSAPPDSQDLLESLAERETLGQMDPLEETVPLGSRAIAVTPVLLGPREPPELLVLQVPSAPQANRATEESLAHKDLQDPLDLLELEEWLDPKDHAETRARRARAENEDRRATEASPAFRVCLDLPVSLVTRVLLDLLAPVEQEDPLDPSVPLEKTVPTVCRARSDPLDLAVALERLVLLVLLVTLAPPAFQAPQVLASTCRPSRACPSRRRARTPCAT